MMRQLEFKMKYNPELGKYTRQHIYGEGMMDVFKSFGKKKFSQKQLTSESFDNDNKLTLESFFAFCSVFFLQGQTEERWKRLLDRHSVRFPKYSSVTLKS